jgi:hypothetical protein
MNSSLYSLCTRLFFNTRNSNDEQKHIDTNLKSVDSKTKNEHPYRTSATPYKDALMKNLVQITFKNRSVEYYSKLGNQINAIVDQYSSKRIYRYWWVEEYMREKYIKHNRVLLHDQYNIITKNDLVM